MKQDPQRSENGLVAMRAIHRPHGLQKLKRKKPVYDGLSFYDSCQVRQGLALRRCYVIATF
ncbi:hypothetical protein [Pseudomonas viridiflava]